MNRPTRSSAGCLALALTLAAAPARGQSSGAELGGFEASAAASDTGGSNAALGSAANSGLILLSLMDPVDLGSSALSDCWGYTSPSGREYAIACTFNGTAWVEVTDPVNPVVVSTKVGPMSTWRDVKVYQDHAYVVCESGSGIQVFDMSGIDTGKVLTLPDVLTGGNPNTHNVAIDEDSGFLYRCGGGNDGLRIYDLNQSISSPPFVGSWTSDYVHDAQIVTYTSGPAAGKQVAYCLTGSRLRIIDVTNKANLQLMDTVTYPQTGYAHQGWLDENRQYFYVNDESDEPSFGLPTTTIVMDVSDPSNASYVGKFDNGVSAVGHNGYIVGDLLYEANYTSGLRVFDLSVNPLNPPEVAWYDTSPSTAVSTDGLWSVYPFFPSGLVIGTDQQEGLFVWFDEELVDITFSVPPPAFLQPAGQMLSVSITESSPGVLVGGTETLHYDDGSGWQSTPLTNLGGGSYQGQFPSLSCGTLVKYYLSAESTNGFTWYEPMGGIDEALDALVATGSIELFADDFEQDLGWLPQNAGATAGDLDRGIPVNDPGWPFDPFADADGSGQCWLTENALGNTDVDNGNVRLESPSLDLTGSAPVIQYDYYLYLTDESGTDFMKVKANDNAGSGWQDVALHTTSGGTDWRRSYLEASDFLAAGVGLTSNVTLRFVFKDADPQSTVEGGVDGFKLLELSCAGVANYCTAGTTASGCQIQLASSGSPSLSLPSGFVVTGANGEGSKDGLFFYGQNGQQASPWGNGTSYQCVTPPVRRTPIQSGGGSNGTCTATFSIDFNAFAAANPSKAPVAGVPTQLQLWFRDPLSTSNQTTSLSDALDFVMAP